MGVTFVQAVSDYVGDYLPMRNCSSHTIRSYCYGLISFMEFAECELDKGVSAIKPDDITYELGCIYVDRLKEKGLCAATVNQRMSCLKEFMRYLARRNIAYLQAKESIANIKRQREHQPKISWMSVDEVRLLLSIPRTDTENGLRDLLLLALLYDSAARVQELCDLNLRNIDMRTRTVKLTGKGRKTRIVPLSAETANIVKKFIQRNRLNEPDAALLTNRQGGRLTASGVQWIINKYVEKARELSGGKLFANKITPHVFRHSKAMHMLDAGVELIYIRDFLGHKSVITTEVYARASPEAKRKILEKHSHDLNLTPKRIAKEKEMGIIERIKAIARNTH